MDPSIVHAATDAEVQTALRTKVSRERVGKEISSMLRGPSPGDALTLLCRFKLFDIVFAHGVTHPEALKQMAPDVTAWACLHSARSLDALLSAHANAGGEPFGRSFSCEEREWLVLAAFLAPLQNLSVPGKKNKPTQVVDTVVKEALKLRVKDADVVNLVLCLSGEMRGDLLGGLAGADGSGGGGGGEGGSGAAVSFSRVEAGRLMRRGKEHWRLALLLGAVLEMPGVAVLAGSVSVHVSIVYALCSNVNLGGYTHVAPVFYSCWTPVLARERLETMVESPETRRGFLFIKTWWRVCVWCVCT